MKKGVNFLAGIIIGATLFGGTTAVAASGILATLSSHPIYVDGRQVSMESYNINGNNYVKLRDIGEKVGFNVYWENGVQVNTEAVYTGVAPLSDATNATAAENSSSTIIDTAVFPVDIDAARNQIVSFTNDLRRENGVSILSVNETLMQAAQVRAEEMANTTTYAHTRPNGSKYSTVTDCPYVAENINRIAQLYLDQQNKSLAEATMDSWSHAEGHLANMLSAKADAIGVGIAKGVNDSGKAAWYCVQEFLYKGYTVTQVYMLK